MADALYIERCPESGICTIRRGDGAKVDLMPVEVEAIRGAGDPEQVREAIADSDAAFAAALTTEMLTDIGQRLA